MAAANVERRRFERTRRQVRTVNRTPVKHYVRRYGWLEAAKDRSLRLGRPLRLLTLCGEDAFDVFLLAQEGLLRQDARGFPDVSWCELSPETAASLNRRLGQVNRTFLGSLEKLAQDPDFDDWFPFDVVNLDFTSAPFPRRQPPFNSTWEAVEAILANQHRHGQGVELFLTFNAGSYLADPEAVDQLVSSVRRNFQARPWSKDVFLAASGDREPEKLSSEVYDTFLLVSLPKFVGRLASDQGFLLKGLRRFFYRRYPTWGPSYRIVKFLLSLDPQATPSRRLDSPARHEIAAQSYDDIVRQSFESVGIDVDDVLRAQPQLEASLRNEVKRLLRTRRAPGRTE